MDDLQREPGPLEDLEDDNDSSDNDSSKSKKSNLPVVYPMCAETPRETGFHRSTRACLEMIKEALLHHRWQEAAEYMACYPQLLEDPTNGKCQQYKELIWRFSAEILHHHPKSRMEDYNNIYERMKHSGVKHFLMISLEHCFHLLHHGHIEDAKHQLSVAESWRYGKESAAQYQKTKLIHAYRSLLDYLIWCDKKYTYSNKTGKMLEFYDNHEEALKVLTDYANDEGFPPNPNAQVYLYQYLKRRSASGRNLKKVLKNLHSIVPSHELMPEYSTMLLQSEKNTNIQKALGVVLDLLDFACWRSNLDVEDWRDRVAEKMAARKDWWPALHFTRFHASKDSEENPELMGVKAPLTKVLCPDLTLKYTAWPVTSAEGR
ncbi:TATA box-binding protein-associated factor RNA polymerase I subunit A [Liparis tanakae]|uniref:TATA box-binding protein-associated factor RNA polymerase I subunit A n=1 Tax=Liparis tanakae TaxID=230148 RepID=A0A4Z2IDN6_9TELE|nr:TATA box-binding protein-associated factor RNA polymerase I subunit A [Liparis tanakae]